MRLLRSSVLGLVCVFTIFGTGAIPLTEFKARREALRKTAGQAVVIVMGAREGDNGELRSGFFQDADFYYLTGWTEPGAILVMTPSTEALLIPKRNAEQERWTGPKLAPGDANVNATAGFDSVLQTSAFELNLPKWAESVSSVYTLSDSPEAE